MKQSRFISMMFLVLLLVAGVSCSTDNMASPGIQEDSPALVVRGSIVGGLVNGLLTCRPLPSASVSKAIGPRGGTINMGPHTIYFPPNALSRTVTITAQVVSDSVNSVRLLPEGLTFAKESPARLTLSYGNCSLVGRLLPKKIVYTTESLQLLEILTSVDNPLTQQVQAPLGHFSRYAIAY